MYNEESGIATLFGRLVPILDGISPDWEAVCVNDGSSDGTLGVLKQWHAKDPRIKIISFSRNFGKEASVTAGLHHARGQAVIPLDADLQDPPEAIPEMVARWREGFKVVLATRRSRHGDSWFKRITSWLFYHCVARVLRINIPMNTGDFRLLDQQVVEVLRHLPERSRFMKGLFTWVGFTSTHVYIDRPARSAGRTKFGMINMWEHAKDGIFSFTTLPLRLTTYLGIVISTLSFSYAGWLLWRTIVHGVDVPGYASLMATVLCMGGVQLICLGIIGEYLGRIYREAKQRPLYVIEESTGITPITL